MTTAKGRATRARILEAAVDMLVAGGAENLNLDEVLRATSTSKGQLFHYFPGGKDDVRSAATQRQLERLVEASTPARLDTWEAWERWIETMVRLHERQGRGDPCEGAAPGAPGGGRDTASRAR